MKHISTLVIIILSFLSVRAQNSRIILPVDPIYPVIKPWEKSNHATYVGISVGTHGEQYLRLEHDVTDHNVILQGSFFAGLDGKYGAQYKLGVGYAPKDSKLRIYCFMPYFNLRLDQHGYNTPFCLEGFYGLRRLQMSVNLDIYTEGVVLVPSARLRWQFLKFRL